jgi:hypothetical protein
MITRTHTHQNMALVVLWFVVIALVHYQATAVTATASVMRDSTCYSTLFGQAPPPYPKDVTSYQSAANVWADLDAFDALYISYYSCAYVVNNVCDIYQVHCVLDLNLSLTPCLCIPSMCIYCEYIVNICNG